MRLGSTADSLEVLLGGAITTNQLQVVVDYSELTTATGGWAGDNSHVLTNGTTAVTALAAPASGKIRVVDNLTVFNADTVAATVTVRLNDGGTFRTRQKVTLATGETLQYTRAEGWATIAADGSRKGSGTVGGGGGTTTGNPQNWLINGGFDYFQRQAPGTVTIIAAEDYGPDRWRCSRENADINAQRIDTDGALESGITGRFYAKFKKTTSTGKMHVCQPIEARWSFPLASRTVTLQVRLKASANKTLRLGLIQLTSAGTVDNLPATIVPTTWGATGTDPTLGANLSRVSPVSVPTGAQGTVNGNGVDCAVTTSWQIFAATFTVPSNAKNLIPAVWTDAGFAANDTFSMAEAQLVDGSATVPWLPRSPEAELALCQRYFCKTFDIDDKPQQGGSLNGALGTIAVGASSAVIFQWFFPTGMRLAPTITTFNTQNSNSEAYDSGIGDCTGTSQTSTTASGTIIQAANNAGGALGDTILVHATARIEL
jgi:hypothetical protein